ncbi:MAG: hypothetical protein U0S12_12650 [Fimbriimonadales bacterium]
MQEVLNVLRPISLIVGIASVIGAAVVYWFALQVSAGREQVRKLKVAMERDPGPGDIAAALRLFPAIASTPQKFQQDEFKRVLKEDEMKRGKSFETFKAFARFFVIIAFVAVVLFLVSTYWKPS